MSTLTVALISHLYFPRFWSCQALLGLCCILAPTTVETKIIASNLPIQPSERARARYPLTELQTDVGEHQFFARGPPRP
eukprot:1598163-Amphidinium_carterae.1